MSTTLSPSNLKIVDAYNDATWWSTYNDNFTLLNSTLLKLSALQDVEVVGLLNGQILVYSTAAGKWIHYTPPKGKVRGRKVSLDLAVT